MTDWLCSTPPRPSRTGISRYQKINTSLVGCDAWCNPSSQLLPLHSRHQKYKALFINCWCSTIPTARRLLSVLGGCSLLRSVQLAVPSWQHSPHLTSSHMHATERWHWHSLRVREWDGVMFSSIPTNCCASCSCCLEVRKQLIKQDVQWLEHFNLVVVVLTYKVSQPGKGLYPRTSF